MQNTFTVLKILCALPMHPPAPTPVLPSAPGNTDLLSPQLDYKEDRVLKN